MHFFGLAVLVGNYAGLDNLTLNTASGLYLFARLMYNYFYINVLIADLRTFAWVTSLFSLFTSSSNQLN
ncbi:hypothetical protein B0H34DRAFT_715290 [Crassisporium funariophilum]|nr:hypothetical protein B0H34DRAFT_715290 [Crassisporium funariophilum]